MSEYKHLILDIGGVIVDDNDAAPLRKFKSILGKNYNRSLKELQKLEAECDAGIKNFSDYVKRFNEICDTKYTVHEYQTIKHSIINFNWELIDFCKTNNKNFRTSILSDNSLSNIQYYNKKIRLDRWSYQHCYSYYYKITKPNPKIYKILLSKMKANPNECIFVDDHIENIRAAISLGITGILFKNNKQLLNELKSKLLS